LFPFPHAKFDNIRPDFKGTWTFIKFYFRATYGIKMEESRVLNVVQEVKMKPDKNATKYESGSMNTGGSS
jgi:hypothetical protein